MPLLQLNALSLLDAWLRSMLWESHLPNAAADVDSAFEVHRLKGRIMFSDGSVKIIQAVRDVFDILDGADAPVIQGHVQGKIVLIGRNLSKDIFQESLLLSLGIAP